MGNKQHCFVHHQWGPGWGRAWNLGLDSHLQLCWHVSASLRAAAWGLLIEWLLCCEGADWNQLEINPLYLSLHSSAGHTPDGAAICVSFYLALLAHRQLAASRKNGGERRDAAPFSLWGGQEGERYFILHRWMSKYSPGWETDVMFRNIDLW